MSNPRQCIVYTAQGWYEAARAAQDEGKMREAVLYMENAFNHTENALAALLQNATFKDQPPRSGRPKMTLAEMRAELATMAGAHQQKVTPHE